MASDQPNLGFDEQAFCPDCLRSLWQGGRCKRRDCPGYAPIYLRDQAERLRRNLAAWNSGTCLVTLTAPGADVLPWDRSKCGLGEHVCSGQRGCRINWVSAAEWNATATGRLGDLLTATREQVRRTHGGTARVWVLAIVFEAQQRGAFHPHIVLGYRTAADRAALDTFRDTLQRKRGDYGFGVGQRGSFDAGMPDRFSGSHAGRYIAKYLRPAGAKRSFVPLLEAVAKITPRDPQTNRLKVLVRPVYVSPTLTRATGVTMGYCASGAGRTAHGASRAQPRSSGFATNSAAPSARCRSGLACGIRRRRDPAPRLPAATGRRWSQAIGRPRARRPRRSRSLCCLPERLDTLVARPAPPRRRGTLVERSETSASNSRAQNHNTEVAPHSTPRCLLFSSRGLRRRDDGRSGGLGVLPT